MTPNPAIVRNKILQLPNPRATVQSMEVWGKLPQLVYLNGFHERALSGGPLTYLEAKVYVIQKMVWNKFQIDSTIFHNSDKIEWFTEASQAFERFNNLKYSKAFQPLEIRLWRPAPEIFHPRAIVQAWDRDRGDHKTPTGSRRYYRRRM